MSKQTLLLPLLAFAALLIVDVALDATILSKGLRGDFGPSSASSATSESSSNALTAGGAPVATKGACAFDVSLQAEGESPLGIPMDWHNSSNIIVKVCSRRMGRW